MPLTPGLQIPFGIQPVQAVPVDSWSGPYTGADLATAIAAANSAIPSGIRFQSMEVRLVVGGTSYKYWYKNGTTDSDLVEFSGGGSSSGAFTLTSGIVTSGYIGDSAVLSGNIGSGQIGIYHIASGVISTATLGSGQVVSGNIASGIINQFSLSSGAVNSGHIGNDAVVSGSIASGTIGTFHISQNAINSGQINSGAVSYGNIASGAVTSGMLGNASVVSGTIASGVINLNMLASGAVFSERTLEQLNTGLLFGGNLTFNSGSSTFGIGSGTGMILVPRGNASGDPQLTYVQWNEFTNVSPIYSGSITYISINSGGIVVKQNDPFTLNEYLQEIVLGYVVHLSGTIINQIHAHPSLGYAGISQLNTFARVFGGVKVEGLNLFANGANLQVNREAGTSFAFGGNYNLNLNSPSVITDSQKTTVNFNYIYRSATPGKFTFATPVTDLSPDYYDDGTGTLNSIGGGQYTIQRVFFVPNDTNNVYIYYGRATYTSTALAAQNIFVESFSEDGFTNNAAVFIGYIISKGNATELNDPAQCLFIQAGQFRNTAGGGGGVTGQTINDLTDVNAATAVNNQVLMYEAGMWVNSYIVANSMASGSVTSGAIASGSVGQYAIASGSITAQHIASGAVISADVADDAVISGKVASGVISWFNLASGFITSGLITSGMLGNDSVVSGSIASGQIGINHLASGLAFKINNESDNRILTSLASGSNQANAESNLTYDGTTLNIQSTASGSTVFSVDGISGNLFSINDTPYGNNILSVENLSGNLIFAINTEGYQKTVSCLASGQTSNVGIFSVNKTDGNAAFFDYYCKNTLSSSSRAGNISVVWDESNDSIDYTELSTNDINGSTEHLYFSTTIETTGTYSGKMVLSANISSGSWNIKAGARIV